jgi:hypothetical protein
MSNSTDDGDQARPNDQDGTPTPALPEASASADGADRSSPRPEASVSADGADRSFSPSDIDAGDEGRAARHTERPVAHSVKPPPPAPPSTKRGFVWVAMLGLLGVAGFMLRQPQHDASPALAARVPSESQSQPALGPLAESPTAPAEPNAPSEAPLEPAATVPTAVTPLEPAAAIAATNIKRDTTPARPAGAPSPKVAARALTAPEVAVVAPSAVEPAKPAPFNHKAANTTLDQSAKAASSCRRGSDPSGVARAVVSFAPTGRVTAAVISGPPFAGTETGSCIARTLRQAVIPAFSGDITTVAKTVEVQ